MRRQTLGLLVRKDVIVESENVLESVQPLMYCSCIVSMVSDVLVLLSPMDGV